MGSAISAKTLIVLGATLIAGLQTQFAVAGISKSVNGISQGSVDGVGPMTITMLMANTLRSAKLAAGLAD